MHLINKKKYENNIKYFDCLLLKFNIFKRYDNINKNKIIDFPLHCSDLFLTDKINFESNNKIVMYGNINRFGPRGICKLINNNVNQHHYRREWKKTLENKLNNNFLYVSENAIKTSEIIKNYTFGFVCTYYPYQFTEECRKEHDDSGINDFRENNDYSNLIESYMIGKFFEVPGSGLLMLADTKYVENFFLDYGFIDFENYININYNNIDDIIEFIYNPNNKDKINQIRINGFNHIKKIIY